MKITTVVLAHGDAFETVNRHLPIWKEYCDKLIIVSPNNNPCMVNGIDCFSYEGRQHFGQLALKRQLFAMKIALFYEADYYVFLEYDALMLERPKPLSIFQGNVFNSEIITEKQHRKMKNEGCFVHFPWIFPADQLVKFTQKVKIEQTEETPHDVWLAQKIMDFDFKFHNLLCQDPNVSNEPVEGYSRNSFDTPELLSNAICAVKKGAYALHGIKTKEIFNEIMETRKQFKIKSAKIFTYYDDINFKNQNELLDLWKKSWQERGFNPIVLTPNDAKKSPFYNEFLNGVKYIHTVITGQEIGAYGISCYLRWLAYSTQNEAVPFLVSDYDVINKKFMSEEVANLPNNNLFLMDGYCPCLAYGTPEQFLRFCKDIIDITLKNKDILKKHYTDKQNGCYHDQEFIVLNSEREKYNICHDNQKYVSLYIKDDSSTVDAKIFHVAHRSVCESKEKFPELKDIDSDQLRLQLIKNIL